MIKFNVQTAMLQRPTEGLNVFKCISPCPVAEWLERRAEEHICPRCAGSKPARANVMICLNL